MGFVPRWDTLILRDWGAARNEMAVLTTYVADRTTLGLNLHGGWEVPHLCCTTWGEGGNVRNEQAKVSSRGPGQPEGGGTCGAEGSGP